MKKNTQEHKTEWVKELGEVGFGGKERDVTVKIKAW